MKCSDNVFNLSKSSLESDYVKNIYKVSFKGQKSRSFFQII